jgi:hypothetical protein
MEQETVADKVRTAAEWKEFVEAQAGSGKRIAVYCRDNGVATHRFYYWRARWFNKPTEASSSFVECRVRGTGTSALTLDCPGGYRLEIRHDCDAKLLEQTLKVLRRC